MRGAFWVVGPMGPQQETVETLGRRHEADIETKRFWLNVEKEKCDGDGAKPGTISIEDAVLRRESDGGPFHATGYYNDGDSRQLVDIEGGRHVIEHALVDDKGNVLPQERRAS